MSTTSSSSSSTKPSTSATHTPTTTTSSLTRASSMSSASSTPSTPLASLPTVKRPRNTTNSSSTQPSSRVTYTTSFNDDVSNSFFSGSPLKDGVWKPPRYITRQTTQEMARQSDELTRRELGKLKAMANGSMTTNADGRLHPSMLSATASSNTSSTSATSSTSLPSPNTDTRLHEMMCKYADKQQEMCAQICALNQRLQEMQDRCFTMKEEHQKDREQLAEECDHLKEVNTGYEEDIEDWEQKYTTLESDYSDLQTEYDDMDETLNKSNQSLAQTKHRHRVQSNMLCSALWVAVTGVVYLMIEQPDTTTPYEWLTEQYHWLNQQGQDENATLLTMSYSMPTMPW